MIEKKLRVQLKDGLQARPAALFVQEANRFSSNVYLIKDGKKANAKSIMGVMSLAVGPEVYVTLLADGNDEADAITALERFIVNEVL